MADIQPVLQRLGLVQYYEAFLAEGFDTWETVLDIQENDLYVMVSGEYYEADKSLDRFLM